MGFVFKDKAIAGLKAHRQQSAYEKILIRNLVSFPGIFPDDYANSQSMHFSSLLLVCVNSGFCSHHIGEGKRSQNLPAMLGALPPAVFYFFLDFLEVFLCLGILNGQKPYKLRPTTP
ncbi:MAG: hypothetical protein KatS3mg096_729 [Candidatus Parcubacteria bacterium]|nr:MAG: hypothetical protein KatS3mg096_729 [Candidatus Parcubacteria bacterium]